MENYKEYILSKCEKEYNNYRNKNVIDFITKIGRISDYGYYEYQLDIVKHLVDLGNSNKEMKIDFVNNLRYYILFGDLYFIFYKVIMEYITDDKVYDEIKEFYRYLVKVEDKVKYYYENVNFINFIRFCTIVYYSVDYKRFFVNIATKISVDEYSKLYNAVGVFISIYIDKRIEEEVKDVVERYVLLGRKDLIKIRRYINKIMSSKRKE